MKYYKDKKVQFSKQQFTDLGLDYTVYIREFKKTEIPPQYWQEDMGHISDEDKIYMVFTADGKPAFWVEDRNEIETELREVNKENKLELGSTPRH